MEYHGDEDWVDAVEPTERELARALEAVLIKHLTGSELVADLAAEYAE